MADIVTAADVGIAQAPLSDMLDEMAVTRDAHTFISETDAYQGMLRTKYARYHQYYAPPLLEDQWIEDRVKRPGKIHMTINIIQPAVNIDARLQSILPRISLKPNSETDQERLRAEAAEKLMLEWLDLSGWDVWLGTLCRVKSLYGKGVLKVFWDNALKRPDVRVVENPANLRVGWGSSDFSVIDKTLYEYAISPQECAIRFPKATMRTEQGKEGRINLVVYESVDKADPLNMTVPGGGGGALSRPTPYMPSGYEQKQVRIWDYWFKRPDDKGGFTVCNAMFLEGTLVTPAGSETRIIEHSELPDIPYIVIPQDTEPGSPEGLSLAAGLIDLQDEFNRAKSHWAQLVSDEIDPAWVLEGENAESVPSGLVPKSGEILAAGSGNKITALDKNVNIFPVEQLIQSFWDDYHKTSGLSEILFGQMPGAQTSGRAVAIQIESASNRLDPRRRLLYQGLRELLVFWTVMAERMNPKFAIGTDEAGKPVMKGVKDIVGDYRRWKIVAPEITPRDDIENTQNQINKVNGMLSSRESAMDEIGIDSPQAELQKIRGENMDAQLNPATVQTFAALLMTLSQFMQSNPQMMQQLTGAGLTAPGPMPQLGQAGPPQNGVQLGQAGQAQMQQAQFAAQPQAVGEDQNQPQPMTQAGMPPPAGGQGPLQSSTMIQRGQANNRLMIGG